MADPTPRSSRHIAGAWRPLVVLVTAAACACAGADGEEVILPGGPPGIGFDDLRWSATLGKVIVPGGRAGSVYLVSPDSNDVTVLGGFGATPEYSGGHDDGPTSADEGRGLLFVSDRTTQRLSVLDPGSGKVLGDALLAASPDYVRWVGITDELWVTEPARAQIEIFALSGGGTPRPVATIAVPNGPESLVIDEARGHAYTHNWQASTVAVDLRTRTVVARWANGCAASRGIDLEPEHGWVLTTCNEGTLTVADPADGGRIVASIAAGAGYDLMGYARTTRHVYLAGGACRCLTIVGLSMTGHVAVLGRRDAPSDTHCAVADDRGHAWVCSPAEGALLRVDDPFPSWGVR